MLPDIVLQVDGQDYRGWESLNVSHSMQDASGAFRITYSERWVDQQEPWPIKEGSACKLMLNGQAVIDGFVDDFEPEYDAENHQLTVIGRDRTADIIDSSATIQQFNNQKLDAIARALCKPHGVNVFCDVDVGAEFLMQAVNPGETVHECIERLARCRAVLLLPENGGLRITKPSTESVLTPLVLGQNIKRGMPRFSHRERFYAYEVKSDTFGGPLTSLQGRVFDTAVRTTRKRILVAEEPVGLQSSSDRALWQRNICAGRGKAISYIVQGWTMNNGKLWPINRMVQVRDKYLQLDTSLLIVERTFNLDVDTGMTTQLTVMPREAFELVALPEEE